MGINTQLTRSSFSKYLNWLGVKALVCFRCGDDLLPGDYIHRCGHIRIKNKFREVYVNPHCRFYHSRCFEGLFL